MPDMPTIGETLPNFSSSTWVGVFLPPKTPTRIAERLNVDFNDGLRIAEVERRFRDNGCEPLGTTPADAAAFVRNEADRWGKVIKAAGIRPE
jgi:tripartite-type tricarboxylate transporter receptor subunit TctC